MLGCLDDYGFGSVPAAGAGGSDAGSMVGDTGASVDGTDGMSLISGRDTGGRSAAAGTLEAGKLDAGIEGFAMRASKS